MSDMAEEARLTETADGLVPASEGWFVLNVRDAVWYDDDTFGSVCHFEGTDLEFPQLGINVRVLEPGQPNGRYHAESNQEDFLVLAGGCLLLVEGQERRLEAWDFVHCAPQTEHIFVGAGEGPCIILMAGRRAKDRTIVYPLSELALRHKAGVAKETTSPAEAYAEFEFPGPGRPRSWDELPWSRAEE
jgi:uncharacterized cupin superfamily protein